MPKPPRAVPYVLMEAVRDQQGEKQYRSVQFSKMLQEATSIDRWLAPAKKPFANTETLFLLTLELKNMQS